MMKRTLKIISSGNILAGVILLSATSALAIDPPQDDAKPPAVLRKQVPNQAPDRNLSNRIEPMRQGIPFVGIVTASLPEMVAVHLGLDPSSGVIVRTVQPGSPASKAGLTNHDIILKIAGNSVRSPEELSTLIRSKKIGDSLNFEIIHKGERTEIEVTLGERPLGRTAGLGQQPLLEGLTEGDATRLRDLIQENLQSFGHRSPSFGNSLDEWNALNDMHSDSDFEGLSREMHRRLGQGSGEQPHLGNDVESSSTVRMMDSEGWIEIETSGDHTEVTVRDRSNNVVWSGPWNSEEDKASAPESVRSRIGQASPNPDGSFSFRFHSLNPTPDIMGR